MATKGHKHDPLKTYAEQIRNTGFELEYRVATALNAAGWSVISNKYYLDDTEERVREIDLVAYKVRLVQKIRVFTSLNISCKKSESNAWALLARKPNLADPNSNWTPLHVWTNDKALEHECSQPLFDKAYHDFVRWEGVSDAVKQPSADVFAFQEMDRNKGTPQNDKAIFSAVTSLMKAQAYELQALPRRKKEASAYQFNLLSVLEGDLVRLDFDDKGIHPSAVDTEHYLARYIVQKKEIFARVHFVRSTALATVLEDYERLHSANCKLFSEKFEEFYQHAVSDAKRRSIFEEKFLNDVRWRIEFQSRHQLGQEISAKTLWCNWDEKKQELCLNLDNNEAGVAILNQNLAVFTDVRQSLLKHFKFSGNFRFEFDDIPF